jgi:hypothetical protein
VGEDQKDAFILHSDVDKAVKEMMDEMVLLGMMMYL